MTHDTTRVFRTLLLVRAATDDYLQLPDNSTEDDKRKMIVYVGAMCKLLLMDMERHAGISWSSKMDRVASGISLLDIMRKDPGRELDTAQSAQSVSERDKKERA